MFWFTLAIAAFILGVILNKVEAWSRTEPNRKDKS